MSMAQTQENIVSQPCEQFKEAPDWQGVNEALPSSTQEF